MPNSLVGGEKIKLAKEIYCEDCGMKLNHEGGCVWCPHCGWNRCG